MPEDAAAADMAQDIQRGMFAYYDERAPEYEEAYTRGTGTCSIRDPEVFKRDARKLADAVANGTRGRIMDLACGTAYWMPHYARACSRVTLFDQSTRMLAEARTKADRLGILDRCVLLQGDFFTHRFDAQAYDTVLVGFFLSHLTEREEALVFDAIRQMLVPGGQCLILESAWSAERAAANAKVERQTRRLNDGTSFEIYKRYCDRADIARWAREHGFIQRIEYFGPAFCAVSGTFHPAPAKT
jgi:demethylmenaquinone methyltransferase/2-methoxy-6-polyprenyl-1,4-benzoquinol methylase